MINQYFLAVPILAYIPCMLPMFVRRVSVRQHSLLLLSAFILHCIVLILNIVISPLFWLSSPALTMSMVSALLMLSLIVLRLIRPKLSALDKVILPLSTTMLFIATLSPASDAGLSTEAWILVHLCCILLGFLFFTLAFAFASLYLLQRQRLKQKNFHQLSSSPNLNILDSYNYYAILVGFACLTIGSIMGLTQTKGTQELALDWTILATGILWMWYAVAIYTRIYHGRQGRWAAWFSVLGFSTVCILMLSGAVLTGDWHLGDLQ